MKSQERPPLRLIGAPRASFGVGQEAPTGFHHGHVNRLSWIFVLLGAMPTGVRGEETSVVQYETLSYNPTII